MKDLLASNSTATITYNQTLDVSLFEDVNDTIKEDSLVILVSCIFMFSLP